jgi:AcrR family transcriptional regulator
MPADVHSDQARRIDRALALLAAAPDPRPLPDPTPLYWRAQVIARLGETRQAAERAVRPLAWLQRASLAAAALALAAGAALGWDLVAAELDRLASAALPAGGPDPTALAALAAGLAVAVLGGGGLALLHALTERA